MDLIKIGIIFAAIIIVVRMNKPLYMSMGAGIITSLILYQIPFSAYTDILKVSIFGQQTVVVVMAFYTITFLQRMLEKRGRLMLAERSISRIFNSRRINATVVPFIIGMLPSAGAVLIAAPIVVSAAGEYLDKDEITFVTSYYRHISESFVPTYSSIILALTLTGISMTGFVIAMLPMVLALFLIGYFLYVRKIPRGGDDLMEKVDYKKEWINVLKSMWAIVGAVLIILVSGFLGVGKTTLIQKLLDELIPEHYVMIIENDFGDINIDIELLGGYELVVKEINAGCICCSLVGDFEKAIVEIERDFSPDVIIIEPSGVADTSHIVNVSMALDYGYELNSINLIDGNNHFLYLENFHQFYKNQILSANTIVINRTGELSTEEVSDVKNSVMEINSKGKVVIDEDKESLDVKEILKDSNQYKNFFELDMEMENVFEYYSYLSLVLPDLYEEDRFLKMLNSLIKDEKVKRIKGIINLDRPVRVDYTKDYDTSPSLENFLNYKGVGKLVIIGDNFDEKRARDIFRR